MKTTIIYTYKDCDTFHNFYKFLNQLEEQIDNAGFLTTENEKILNNAHAAIAAVQNMFVTEEDA